MQNKHPLAHTPHTTNTLVVNRPLRSIRCIPALAATLVAILGCAACGGGSSDVVAQVGRYPITKTTLNHWMSVMAGGRVAPGQSKQRQALRQQVLGFLISSQWVIGEAADEGLKVSKQEIEQRFKAKKSASFPGGEAEFHEFLKATGQTTSDIMLEARAELASSKIRGTLTSKEPKITQAQIARYYSQNKQRFAIPERRELEITNRKSKVEADKLKREVESGKSFASVSGRESTKRPRHEAPGYDATLERAVYAARPNVLTGPVKLRVDYYLFEVKQIIPGREQTLPEVQGSIEKQLATEQQRRTLAGFIKAWRTKWTARTDCHPGFVVQKCRQHNASKTTPPEDPLTLE